MELHYELRTEGASPVAVAAAVFLGVSIGCFPLYGTHLPLIVIAARLFRVSRVRAYLASNVNNPFTLPLILWLEFLVGSRLLRGEWPSLSIAHFREVGILGFSAELLIGSVAVGSVLGTIAAAVAVVVRLNASDPTFESRLREAVSKRYVIDSIFDWEFVRGKLRWDPLYYGLLRSGVLSGGDRLLDLGCGRGIVLATVATARELHGAGIWPDGWPPPPLQAELRGVERSVPHARIARIATGDVARIEALDLKRAHLPEADRVLLLDVLHYMPEAAQDALVGKVARALRPGGRLIVREADAAGGVRFRMTALAERVCAIGRGHFRQRFRFRTQGQWRALLERNGLETEGCPLDEGTPYANVLIVGTKPG